MADQDLVIPSVMDLELDWILSRSIVWCAGVAEVLRRDGHDIARNAESEQSSVIHWLLLLRANHGDDWQNQMKFERDRIAKEHGLI
ncbi:MAG: hypothetical protein AAFV88_25935 [Planctomycetota bacterium]